MLRPVIQLGVLWNLISLTAIAQPSEFLGGTATLSASARTDSFTALVDGIPVEYCTVCNNPASVFVQDTFELTLGLQKQIAAFQECEEFYSARVESSITLDNIGSSTVLWGQVYGETPRDHECYVDYGALSSAEYSIIALTDVRISGSTSVNHDLADWNRYFGFATIQAGNNTLSHAERSANVEIHKDSYDCRLPAGTVVTVSGQIDFETDDHINNGSGAPLVSDLVAFVAEVVIEKICLPDANEDGIVSPADFSAFIVLLNSNDPKADQNGDCQVSAADFSAWIVNFNRGCDWL